MENNNNNNNIINLGIIGQENVGKCLFNKNFTIKFGSIVKPNEFTIKNNNFHIFSIPCSEPDFKDNFEMTMSNSDILIIIININKEINEEDKNYYQKIFLNIFYNQINKILIIFNEFEETNTENNIFLYKNLFNEYLKIYKNFFEINEFEIKYIKSNIKKETNFEEISENLINFNYKNNNNNNLEFILYDKYFDEEDKTFVCSGKLMKGSISIEMNNLNYFTINSKNNNLIKISNIIPKRLCNLNGKYLNKINSPEFITIKFDDSNFINIKEEIISKNSFIFSNENLIIFDTFEANIILFESNLAVVAKGFECNFENYNFNSDVNFLNVNGFYSGEKNEIFNKKNIINTEKNKIVKCILKLKNPILSMKYEQNKKIGSFMLKKDGKIFAVGKILKYKIFN